MKLWKNVLAHVGPREDARLALEASLRIAEAFDGRVTLFDAIAPAGEASPFDSSSLHLEKEVQLAIALRTHQLREVLADIDPCVPVDAEVTRGALGRGLLGCADRRNADLIVKAASAADVRSMTHIGHAAVHVLRQASVPVWLCASREKRSPRVVAAVDLSSSQPSRRRSAELVLLGAARLSLVEGAELHVVCVGDRARDRLYQSILRPAQYRRYLAKSRHELRQSLAKLTARIGPRSVPHLLEGDAFEVVEKLVLELDADAVALGRGQAEPGPGVRGTSFAERLFCRTERSLLLVGSEPQLMARRVAPLREPARIYAS